MPGSDESILIKVLRGVVAGAIAGALASFAMDRFQAVVGALSGSDDASEESEPATEQAADAIAKQTGHEIAATDKPLAGQAIHYALGLGLGVAYGVAVEFRPLLAVGYGSGFGVVTATLLDEAAVPAVGLGSAPWRTDLSTNLYSYASHLVFGVTSELVRRQVASTLHR